MKRQRPTLKAAKKPASLNDQFLEAEVIQGLKPLALDELKTVLGGQISFLPGDELEVIRFQFQGDLNKLKALKTIMGVYLGQPYPIPRPKALLGHQYFQRLLKQIETIRQLYPPRTFQTFRISAAGHGSAVFSRLGAEIGANTGLSLAEEEADLLIRVRPAVSQLGGWEVLCGLTPRPLSARGWRVADMEGALNSTIAAAMIMLTRPKAKDRFLNLMCGSGTLLIERLLAGKAAYALGSDLNGRSLEKARLNLAAAKVKATLLQQDDRRLSFPSQSFEVLVADLPWAQLVGSQAQLQGLYAASLNEAARVALPGARFVLITHQIRLIEMLLAEQAEIWRIDEVVKLAYKNLRPRIYVLVRQF